MLTLRKKILLVLLIICMIMSIVSPLFTYRVYAETTAHSNVLDDLKRDPSFNANDYVRDDKDYNLKVLTVAEGSEGELYVYVYNPAYKNKDLKAAKINLSLQDPSLKNIEYDIKDLTWINSNGGFSKYLVNGIKTTDDAFRYYTITTVYRAHDSSIDDSAIDTDDIVNFEGMPVGQSWCLYFFNGKSYCESREIKYVDAEITSFGFTRYFEKKDLPFTSVFPGDKYIDSHFIAFSVDNFDIRSVYDATLYYSEQTYSITYENFGLNNWVPVSATFGEPVSGLTIDRSYDQCLEINQDSLFYNNSFTLSRIVDTKKFITETGSSNFFNSDLEESGLSKSQFVIRFFETSYTTSYSGSFMYTHGSRISHATILRLHFLDSTGNNYNLGVVADIVSDDGNPDAGVGTPSQINWFKVAFVIIICLLVFNFMKDPSMALTRIILKGICAIITLLFQILLLPFRLLAWFFK